MSRSKKYGRRAITIICQKLVETHESRKKRIKNMQVERESLYDKFKSLNITDMPTSHGGGVSDPVHDLYCHLEELDEAIKVEQHRIDIIDTAIGNIGKNIEPDLAIRKQMQSCILTNIQMGGFNIPFAYMNYPEKYSKDAFYLHRQAFLKEIAQKLYLS